MASGVLIPFAQATETEISDETDSEGGGESSEDSDGDAGDDGG